MNNQNGFFNILNNKLLTLNFTQNKGKTWYKIDSNQIHALAFDRSKFGEKYNCYFSIGFKEIMSEYLLPFNKMQIYFRLDSLPDLKDITSVLLDFENNLTIKKREELLETFLLKLNQLTSKLKDREGIVEFLKQNANIKAQTLLSTKKYLGLN